MKRTLPVRIALLLTAVLVLFLFSMMVLRRQAMAGNAATLKGVLTYHNDNLRTGRNSSETLLTLKNVNANTFGKLFEISADGLVDAQPLYVPSVNIPGNGTHNVLFVATENDTVYGFDADNGSTLWQATMLAGGETPSDDRGCGQVTPEIGVLPHP
jgi:hypothetical protein